MFRLLLSFVFCIVILSSITSAVFLEETYQFQFEKIKKAFDRLNNLVDNSTINFTDYDKWYKDFKSISEDLKSFSSTHREKESFKLLKEVIDKLSLVWGFLKQAEDAFVQYRDFITAGDVGYAYKWREVMNTKRKQAEEMIRQATDTFKKAYSLFGENK